MVQHENGADPGEQRPQQVVRPAEIECFQPDADDIIAQSFH
jgi:hypothetical protein